MAILITFIWTCLISQVTFFLGAALTQNTYYPLHAFIFAIVITGIVASLPTLLGFPKKHSKTTH